MNEEKHLTGYPSMDKPWLKFYTKEQIEAALPECTIYQYIYENNKDYLGNTALNYFDRKISYGELFDGIEKAAEGFINAGVREGDIVPIIAVTLPETIYSFYALNRIGAISNMIDPRTNTSGIRRYIEEVDAKVVVSIDAAYNKVSEAVDNTSVETLIVIAASDSLPFPKKQLYSVAKGVKIKKNTKDISWKSFLKRGANETVKDVPYKKDTCAVIVHTGGTTGNPKGVMLTNDNLNCSAFQCFNSPIDFQRTHNWIDIMPPFIAYGVGNGLHLPLMTGAEVVLVPAFDPEKFDDLMVKYRPVHMVGVPSHYGKLIISEKMQNEDLSYIVAPVVGGDSIPREIEERVNDFFNSHGCTWNLVKGYGMTEVSAAVSVCVSNESNKIGGAGIPFAHTIIAIFDPETGEELSYGKKGEICMTGPNTMLGYYKNEGETANILRKHSDGKTWVHSGDLGYMDEDGQLFVEGRLKRMIVRHDGFKVFPPLLEKTIEVVPDVQSCCVVGKTDAEHSQGRLPVAFVVKKAGSDEDEIIKRIMDICNNELPEYAQPADIRFIDVMPLTPIGKVDYRALEEKCNE